LSSATIAIGQKVLGRGLLIPGWFFVATKSIVSGVGGKMLEFHGGGRVSRGDAKAGANLASLEDRHLLLVSSRALPERWRRSLKVASRAGPWRFGRNH
jgi:hypothetical protein